MTLFVVQYLPIVVYALSISFVYVSFSLFTVRLLELGHLEKRYPIKTKDFQVFCKQTDSIRKFEGCFLRGQVSSNGFKVFNGCIVEYLNFRLQKLEKNVLTG